MEKKDEKDRESADQEKRIEQKLIEMDNDNVVA